MKFVNQSVIGMGFMEYGKITGVNKKVSRIVYGMSAQPFLSGGDGNALLDEVFAAGVNTFDLARRYLKSERSFGRWLSERDRDDVVIISKCAHPDAIGRSRVSEREIRRDFEKSAKELGTDYIDVYLLHRDNLRLNTAVAVEALNALHAEGKIGAFGGSNWTHSRLFEANEYAYKHNLVPFTVTSPSFGLAEQTGRTWKDCVTISGADGRIARDFYARSDFAVVAYSALGHGFFSGKLKYAERDGAAKVLDRYGVRGYLCERNLERLKRCEELAEKYGKTVPQIALCWIFKQRMNMFAVVSSASGERMRSNAEALDVPLTPADCKYLDLDAD